MSVCVCECVSECVCNEMDVVYVTCTIMCRDVWMCEILLFFWRVAFRL